MSDLNQYRKTQIGQENEGCHLCPQHDRRCPLIEFCVKHDQKPDKPVLKIARLELLLNMFGN